jgi:integrase
MASLQKINGNYYAYFYDSDRRPKRKSYPLRVSLKSAAKKYKNRLEREYAEGDFDPWNPGPRKELLSLKEAGERFLENRRQRLRSSSVQSYETALRGLRRTAPTGVLLPDISAKDLRAYILATDIAQATRAKRYRHLLTLFNWSEEGLVERNPMDDVKRPKAPRKVPEYLTPAQVDHLLGTMDRYREEAKTKPGRTPNVQWLKDIIEIAVSTGLRRSALVALHWSDVKGSDLSHVTETTSRRSLATSRAFPSLPTHAPCWHVCGKNAASKAARCCDQLRACRSTLTR